MGAPPVISGTATDPASPFDPYRSKNAFSMPV